MPPRYRVGGSPGPALLLTPLLAPVRHRAVPAVLTAAGRTFPVSRFFLEDVYEATGGLRGSAWGEGAREHGFAGLFPGVPTARTAAFPHRLLHHASQPVLLVRALCRCLDLCRPCGIHQTRRSILPLRLRPVVRCASRPPAQRPHGSTHLRTTGGRQQVGAWARGGRQGWHCTDPVRLPDRLREGEGAALRGGSGAGVAFEGRG